MTYKKMDANYFSSFIDQNFNTIFVQSGRGSSQLWLQDGDPSQNSKAACEAMGRYHSELLKILPQSPDLMPIENIFNLASRTFKKDALQQGITPESYDEFCNKVERTICSISQGMINKRIQAMNGRIADIIRNNDKRLKY